MGKRKSKKGKSAKNNPNRADIEPEELTRAPHSFVIYRGSVGRTVVDFTKDFRKVMEPFTASSLRVRKKNVLKDFAAVAGILHVSHLVMFTSTEKASYVRFGRFPRGPTLTFRMLNYSLSRDVLAQVKKQYAFDKAFRSFPLVVLNNFSGEGPHMKLMATMFQNMFPTINLLKVDLDSVRRCVLFNYNSEDKTIDFRHFGIRVAPVGLSRGVKKLVQSKVPSLARYQDVSEYLLRGDVSESEAEDDGESHVTLPQKLSSRGNIQAGQSAIRLHELGPRMKLKLIKVEGGLCEGEVIYHDLVKKTPEEIAKINKRREEKRRLKEQRKKQQEKNKQEKENKKEELKKKSLEGIERKKKEYLSQGKTPISQPFGEAKELEDVDSDSEWYKKEVGQDPDKDLFPQHQSADRKRKFPQKDVMYRNSKKQKFSNSQDGSSRRESRPSNMNFKQSNQRHSKSHKQSTLSSKSTNVKRFSQKHKRVMGSKVRRGQRHR